MEYAERMREFGAIMAQRLDEVKRLAFNQKNSLDDAYPSWKARRAEFGDDYLRHDSRRELFVSIVTIVENAQLSYMLLRDHLTDTSWWAERIESVSEDKRQSVLYEYAVMVKWFLLHGLFGVVEETLRAIQRAASESVPVAGRHKSIAKVTTAVLEAAGCGRFEELFRLVRCTRNTIHTNGVFLPEDGQDLDLGYKGGRFEFVVGAPLEWLDDQRAVWFVRELTTAMADVVESSIVSGIDYCPRTRV